MKVFVYGTLKDGEANHHLVERANGVRIGEGCIEGFTLSSNGAYPAAVPQPSHAPIALVWGEVYEVDSIDEIDRLEGYPNFYDRREEVVDLGDREEVAWCYFLTRPFSLPVPTGRWNSKKKWWVEAEEG